jgi:hypothetical protein
MANVFSKEERVAFENILTNGQQMERSSDTIWRSMPYIAQSYADVAEAERTGDYSKVFRYKKQKRSA